jgi:hypothetical protein
MLKHAEIIDLRALRGLKKKKVREEEEGIFARNL